MNLADWLLDQVAADEEEARAAGPCRATLALSGQDEDEPEYWDCEQRSGHRTHHGTLSGPSWAAHEPGSWDPARVLAECAAKRAIVEVHGVRRFGHQCVAIDGPTQWHVADPCATLRLLAQPYRDREGYRQEWDVQ